jgi:hypothetical protein
MESACKARLQAGTVFYGLEHAFYGQNSPFRLARFMQHA